MAVSVALTDAETVIHDGTGRSIHLRNTGATRVTVINGPDVVLIRPRRNVSFPVAGRVAALVRPLDGGTGELWFDIGTHPDTKEA